DHPLEYANFEGTIPEGSYGAGTVMVWDMGTYHVLGGDPAAALGVGKLHFVLQGKKLNGEWTLVRMRTNGNGNKPQWLLLKSGVDLPPLSERAETHSVLTNRSLQQIASGGGPEWQSDRPARSRRTSPGSRKKEAQGSGTATADLPKTATKIDLDQ